VQSSPTVLTLTFTLADVTVAPTALRAEISYFQKPIEKFVSLPSFTILNEPSLSTRVLLALLHTAIPVVTGKVVVDSSDANTERGNAVATIKTVSKHATNFLNVFFIKEKPPFKIDTEGELLLFHPTIVHYSLTYYHIYIN